MHVRHCSAALVTGQAVRCLQREVGRHGRPRAPSSPAARHAVPTQSYASQQRGCCARHPACAVPGHSSGLCQVRPNQPFPCHSPHARGRQHNCVVARVVHGGRAKGPLHENCGQPAGDTAHRVQGPGCQRLRKAFGGAGGAAVVALAAAAAQAAGHAAWLPMPAAHLLGSASGSAFSASEPAAASCCTSCRRLSVIHQGMLGPATWPCTAG